MKILPMYGGTEWAADPCAVLVDPSYYDKYQREAAAIFKAHPNIDKVCFGYVGDVSLFLDTTTDFDMHVIGVDEDGEMLYVREEWDCTWRFDGLYETRYSCWLEWYAKHGNETLTCDLDLVKEAATCT